MLTDMITKERFETMLLQPITEQVTEKYKIQGEANNWSQTQIDTYTNFEIHKFWDMFVLHDPAEFEGSDWLLAKLYEQVPITAKVGAVYAIKEGIKPAELIKLEETVKTYCAAYTYEELELDHAETEYVDEDKNPAVFKLALEYTLDDLGVTVTLQKVRCAA